MQPRRHRASAGGIAALIGLLGALPADFPLPILVVLHLAAKPAQPSNLPAVLGWRTRLRVKWAEDDEVIAPGTVYLAPADRHLVVRPGDRLDLSSAARFGWWRPAVDVLFQSVAALDFGRADLMMSPQRIAEALLVLADSAR